MLTNLTTAFMVLLDLLVLLDGDYHGFIVTSVFLLIFIFIESRYDPDPLDKWIYVGVYILNVSAFLFSFYRIEWFDDVAHTLTPLALVMYTGPYIYMHVLDKRSVHIFIKFFALVSLGITMGVAWEVWEYYADIAIFEQLAPTMHDTITDLIFDTIGTTIGTLIVLYNEQ